MVSFLKEKKLAYKWKKHKNYRNKLSYLIQKKCNAVKYFFMKNCNWKNMITQYKNNME